MTDTDGVPSISGGRPSEEEKFYVAWGYRTLTDTLPFLNEVLRQLVTLSSTLLGGSIAFLDDKMINLTLKKFVLIVFFATLIISFFGILPYNETFDVRKPSETKRYVDNVIKLKLLYVRIACILLGTGFVLALIGLLVKR